MKNMMIKLAGVAIVGYGIAGIVFLATAGSSWAIAEKREVFLYAGITCAGVTALILGFGLLASRKND